MNFFLFLKTILNKSIQSSYVAHKRSKMILEQQKDKGNQRF